MCVCFTLFIKAQHNLPLSLSLFLCCTHTRTHTMCMSKRGKSTNHALKSAKSFFFLRDYRFYTVQTNFCENDRETVTRKRDISVNKVTLYELTLVCVNSKKFGYSEKTCSDMPEMRVYSERWPTYSSFS